MKVDITGITAENICIIKEKLKGDFKPSVLMAFDHNGSNQNLYKLIKHPELYSSLKIDSGTFTLNMKGQFEYHEDKFQVYCSFIELFKNEIGFYINFDAVFNGENAFPVNKMYQERMEQIGLNPVYVMHSFEDYEINYVIGKKPRMVAIASAMLKKMEEFKKAVAVVDKMHANGILVHLLGCSSYKRLTMAIRAWSCDASSYARWASLNRIIFYSEREGKEVTLARHKHTRTGNINKDYIFNTSMSQRLKEYEQFIKPLYTIDEILYDNKALVNANAYSMYSLEKRITEMQNNKHIDFPEP